MKRATRAWLRAHVTHGNGEPVDAQDILDSDARQRAEIRDLKARLQAVANAPISAVITSQEDNDMFDLAERSLDLKNKNWRKP